MNNEVFRDRLHYARISKSLFDAGNNLETVCNFLLMGLEEKPHDTKIYFDLIWELKRISSLKSRKPQVFKRWCEKSKPWIDDSDWDTL